MKFAINRLEMLAAAKNAARVAPVRAPVDVLNGILIEGNENLSEVFLTATNFEVSIQQKVKASIEESGCIVVNPQLLVGMLSLLSGEQVTFSADRPDVLKVMGGKAVYEIRCLLAKHYPKPVMPFPDETAKLTGICSLARRTVFAISKDDSKPMLQCVHVKLRQNAVHAAACDGTRMMLVKNDAYSEDNHEFLLPGHSLQLLASISTDADVFEVGDMGKEIVFTKDNMMFTMRKIPGDFMDVTTIVKSIKPTYTAITDAKKMREALSLISVGAGSQPVKLVLMDGQIYLNCDGEIGAIQSAIPATVSQNTPDTGFYYNVDNLYKMFQVVEGKIRLELDNKGMMLIKSRSEVYFQLPMRPMAKKDNKIKKAA